MTEQSEKIGNLKKVSVQVAWNPSDLLKGENRFDFIFGIGAGGLVPFEFEIAGRTRGETVEIPMDRNKTGGFFGHLYSYIPFFPEEKESATLFTRIEKVEHASQSEIIRGMAQTTSCGCDCGCGCG